MEEELKDESHNNDKVHGCKNKEKHCENKKGKCEALESKIKDLELALEISKKEIDEHKTKASQYLNTASYYKNEAETNKKDFERYKERNKNIEIEAKQKADENVAKKLLPVIDNFDQAMSHITDIEIIKGFSMIYASLVNVLTELGIVEISTSDEELNPEYHNCISTEDTDDESLDGKIASIYQKGYKFAESNKVIRPATVSVYKVNL